MQAKRSVRAHMPLLESLALSWKLFGKRLKAWVAQTTYNANPLELNDEVRDTIIT